MNYKLCIEDVTVFVNGKPVPMLYASMNTLELVTRFRVTACAIAFLHSGVHIIRFVQVSTWSPAKGRAGTCRHLLIGVQTRLSCTPLFYVLWSHKKTA
jgi:hypothetical protein